MTDQQREQRIKRIAMLIERYMACNQGVRARNAYACMCELIKGRSAQQVRKMEQERGLV